MSKRISGSCVMTMVNVHTVSGAVSLSFLVISSSRFVVLRIGGGLGSIILRALAARASTNRERFRLQARELRDPRTQAPATSNLGFEGGSLSAWAGGNSEIF